MESTLKVPEEHNMCWKFCFGKVAVPWAFFLLDLPQQVSIIYYFFKKTTKEQFGINFCQLLHLRFNLTSDIMIQKNKKGDTHQYSMFKEHI